MISPVIQLLLASPAVTAVIGSSPIRCYPDIIPQDASGDPGDSLLPAVVYSRLYGDPESYLADAPAIVRIGERIDVYALTKLQASDLFDLVVVALENGSSNVMSSDDGSGYEVDTKRYRCTCTFDFWVSR